MSWMNKLYRTYEANAGNVGKTDDGVPLSPIAHMTAKPQIEIMLTKDGDFAGAFELDKNVDRILIPVTEKSSSRSVGLAPHSLSDTLSYVAGDFADYADSKETIKVSQEKFRIYSEALEKWRSSHYSNDKVNAIYVYIIQKQMLSDLIKCGIVGLNESGKLDGKKISGQEYEKALVRFRILGTSPDVTWEDAALFGLYTDYYLSVQDGTSDICYFSGETAQTATSNPKNIVSAHGNAKLISANDNTNFTFRGRFSSGEEACAISYEASQKAHAALSWLTARQGVNVGQKDCRTYVCWNPGGREVVNFSDPFMSEESESVPDTEPEFRKKLRDTLNGYRAKLDNCDDIVVIGLDAATTGRLAVIYYSELMSSDFYDRLQDWGETCNWYFTTFTEDNKPRTEIRTPLTKQIVNCAYGTERERFIETDDGVMKEQYQRLVFSMIDGKTIPYDLVHALCINASNPLRYVWKNGHSSHHSQVLSTACSVVKKYYISKGVNIKMTLDLENKDRSYLFGRLLAVLEHIERSSYTKDETREPNAIRLQNAYVNHPMSTWKTLEGLIKPYFERIGTGSRIYYKNIIASIVGNFEDDPTKLNKPLGETYLIGYYLQRAELKNKNTNKEEE